MAARSRRSILEAGIRAPDFRLPRLDGGASSLQDLIANGPVLLAFFKVTCPICQLTFPFLERLHLAGMSIFGISQDDAEDTREFNQEFGVTFPSLLDNDDNEYVVSNAFGISSVPTLFLIEPGGLISRAIEGWRKKEMELLGAQAGGGLFRREDRVPEWKAG